MTDWQSAQGDWGCGLSLANAKKCEEFGMENSFLCFKVCTKIIKYLI